MLCTMQTNPLLPRRCTGSSEPVGIARLEAALWKVAVLVAEDPAFAPVFERLEAELAMAVREEASLSEALARARALPSQKAMRATSSATCSREAPMPYRSRSSR